MRGHDLAVRGAQELRIMILRDSPGWRAISRRVEFFQSPRKWGKDQATVIQPGYFTGLGNFMGGLQSPTIDFIRINRENLPLTIVALSSQIVTTRRKAEIVVRPGEIIPIVRCCR